MNAREMALRILCAIEDKNSYANLALSQTIRRYHPEALERRFLTELLYGVLKSRNKLDYIIEQFASRPLAKMPTAVRNILRLSVYQLISLDKVPVSAACNQGTELAKQYGHSGTAKFVNGILRTIVRNMEKVQFPSIADDPVHHLAVEYSHPVWLVRRWLERWGLEQTLALCQANNVQAPLVVRTNTLKNSRDQLYSLLLAQGVHSRFSSLVAEGLILEDAPALDHLLALQQGCCTVQDEGSMMVVHALDPQPGELIIDACAAPGSKTTHIAQRMQNDGTVLAFDVHTHKLPLIQESCQRMGIKIVETKQMDSTLLHQQYTGQADRVLVDAPCSGMGVLRRKPDARWRKTPEELNKLPQLQQAILSSASRCVKPGGVLVYSTCTVEPAENEEVIEHFLCDNKQFTLSPMNVIGDHGRDPNPLQLLPHRHGTDGFFICRMQKET